MQCPSRHRRQIQLVITLSATVLSGCYDPAMWVRGTAYELAPAPYASEVLVLGPDEPLPTSVLRPVPGAMILVEQCERMDGAVDTLRTDPTGEFEWTALRACDSVTVHIEMQGYHTATRLVDATGPPIMALLARDGGAE